LKTISEKRNFKTYQQINKNIMKTKLLKIVRKRYTITMYTKLDNPNFFLYGHPVPVWLATDNYNDFRSHIGITYDDAYKKIMTWIRKDYYSKMNRENRQKQEKVWYKPKN
jgi:hypothetical protein